MDPLTHALTAVALSRAGLNRVCPRATPLMLVASCAPDIDLLAGFGSAIFYLDWHRHFTHTFLFAPLLAAASVGAVSAFRPAGVNLKQNWLRMFLAAAAAVCIHLLLDWTNIYGIRWLLPFSSSWWHGDLTNVVDLWVWGILSIVLVAPFISRLVSAEIGARRSSGRGAAIFALLLLGGYEFGRYVLHRRAVETLEARLYDGAAPVRVMALPTAVNPLRWVGLVETGESFRVNDISLLKDFDPAAGRILPKPERNRYIEAARATSTFRRFLAFSQMPYWRVTPADNPPGAVRVEAMDLRFGGPDLPRFVAACLIDESGRVLRENYTFGPTAFR